MKVRRVRFLSLVCTVTLMAGIWGLVIGTVNAILFASALERIPGGPANLPEYVREGLFGNTIGESALALLVFSVVIWLTCGLVGGVVVGVLYNVAAYFTGGVAVAPEIVVAVVKKGERHDSISYEEYIRRNLAANLPEGDEAAEQPPA